MDSRTASRVPEWDVHPFDGGYTGLRALADADFSGALIADDTWLFMVNGRVIGVFGGSIADFEDADATAHVAPDPALPLLFAMWELDGETRTRYYSEDTSIADVDETLRSGSFTGYIELSENVLSGDYYVLYQAGRSMSVAFLGASERLVTGDDAFERADDEVGIYEVTSVDLGVIEIPAAGAGTAEPEPSTDSAAGDSSSDPSEHEDASVDEPSDSETTDHEDTDEPVDPPVEPAAQGADPGGKEEPGDSPNATTVPDVSAAITDAEGDARSADSSGSVTDRSGPDPNAGPSSRNDDGATAVTAETEVDRSNDAFEEEKRWRETKAIPSLNPDNSEIDPTSGAAVSEAADRPANARSTPEPAAGGRTDGATSQSSHSTGATSSVDDDPTIDDLRVLLERREQQLQSVRDDLATAETNRDELEREVDRLRREVSELRDRVDQLKGERDRLATQLGDDAADVGRAMDPQTALDGTNLFVRYRSKGAATLDAGHAGDADRDAVNENLRIEYHTGFDSDDVAVNGRSFDSFLHDTIEFQFVEWVVRDLLYEIQSTGHTSGLKGLYDAIPEIDRAEIHGIVSLRYTEDGEEYREQQPFDLVIRDRMGHPLFVVDINDSREPADEDTMGTLVKAAIKTKESADRLAGAFQVTSSFFGPGALETAAEATSSGFLSGGSRESFVKLSRKRGFHLCLVETRGGEFHITVPEL